MEKIVFSTLEEGNQFCYIYRFGLTKIKDSFYHITEKEPLAIYKNYLILPLSFNYDNQLGFFHAECEIFKKFDFDMFEYLRQIELSKILSDEEFSQLITEITLQYNNNEEYIKELYSSIS